MTTPGRNLTAERLRALIHYDPIAGTFTWRVTRSKARAGEPAGVRDGDGYLLIRIDGVLYRAARLAWLFVTGEWPQGQVDHGNLNVCDDRWENLRDATHSQNCMNRRRQHNNTSGFKGVTLIRESGRWEARIKYGRRVKYLGTFKTAESAHAAYKAAAADLHGEFARLE